MFTRLLGCNVYVSEGKSLAVIHQLQEVCRRHAQVALVNTFVDEPYHRSSFTLASPSQQALCSAVVDVAERALSLLDLSHHAATHPRLGAVDHISVHPVGPAAQLQHAAQLAGAIAQRLSAPPARLPVFLYGAAHPAGRRLASIRRSLGYFRSDNASGAQWIGPVPGACGDLNASLPPDLGPTHANPASGVCCIGAIPWLVNYNVPLASDNLGVARDIARRISERGGGLTAVEAMGLEHSASTVEVACNLLDTSVSGPDRVLEAVSKLAQEQGIQLGKPYVISKLPEEIVELTQQALGRGATGQAAAAH